MKDIHFTLEELTGFADLPIVPLRGMVMFPKLLLHFDVGRKKSIAALKTAMENDQRVMIVAQRDATVSEPTREDLYDTGVVCVVREMRRIPSTTNYRVVVLGLCRAELFTVSQEKPYMAAVVNMLEPTVAEPTAEDKALMRTLRKEFEAYCAMAPKVSNELLASLSSVDDMGDLTDSVCGNAFFDYRDKQLVLEEYDPKQRLNLLVRMLHKELVALQMEEEIQEQLKREVDKSQKEYYLREEMRIIADELGEAEDPISEAIEYKEKICSLPFSDDTQQKLLKEVDKLMKMPPGSHEGTVVRTYLDKCLELPLGKATRDAVKLDRAQRILDRDHYGLEKVKTRIVESLAVLRRNPTYSGQILCLYGPPGVGKTSIVKSLAAAMNRKYVRVALGGVHDEAEIRGHRRTYIGAMPGRIIDAVIKSGVMNPIILLDEVDKLGGDYKGDPASALLEALDPEQNNSFTDHYIDFPVDLSRVLFITTANELTTIPKPLYDRMEVIELNSYTVEEKFQIAKKHLLKKALKKHSLTAREFKITDGALYAVIEEYTREAGVRGLEKQLSVLCRKAAMALEEGATVFRVNEKNLADYLGVKKYTKDFASQENQVGTVNGLAWTSVGGTMLPIEVTALEGTGKIELTGSLGDVMKESAKTAVSFVRSKARDYGIEPHFYRKRDIHIHAPEAAIPKDGPSAGLAITTALVSELTGIAIKSTVAMTGEISLKGKALPIGGLKEKSMAAYKAGCYTVIIPKDNEKDLAEISEEVRGAVRFVAVSSFDELLPVALESLPQPKEEKDTPSDDREALYYPEVVTAQPVASTTA
ncbi:MAG: endopeptidase La [Eubacterium sp.]|nr:endopeptidase La [Eubacterium sp.]